MKMAKVQKFHFNKYLLFGNKSLLPVKSLLPLQGTVSVESNKVTKKTVFLNLAYNLLLYIYFNK